MIRAKFHLSFSFLSFIILEEIYQYLLFLFYEDIILVTSVQLQSDNKEE